MTTSRRDDLERQLAEVQEQRDALWASHASADEFELLNAKRDRLAEELAKDALSIDGQRLVTLVTWEE